MQSKRFLLDFSNIKNFTKWMTQVNDANTPPLQVKPLLTNVPIK